jgi:hypothetical protein
MSRHRVLLLAAAIVGVVAIVVFVSLKNDDDAKPEATSEVEKPFIPRRSSRDLSQGIERLRQERGGLPAEIAAAGADGEAREFAERQAELQRQQTPELAEAQTREQLAQIETQLAAAPTAEERERLERRKKLMESILSKLERMGQ